MCLQQTSTESCAWHCWALWRLMRVLIGRGSPPSPLTTRCTRLPCSCLHGSRAAERVGSFPALGAAPPPAHMQLPITVGPALFFSWNLPATSALLGTLPSKGPLLLEALSHRVGRQWPLFARSFLLSLCTAQFGLQENLFL